MKPFEGKRYGKKHETAKRQSMAKWYGKSDREAKRAKVRQKAKTVFDEKAARVARNKKRAAAQCCKSTNNVRTHEYTIHTIKLHSHEYRLNIHTQTYYLYSWNMLTYYLHT